MKKLIFVFGMLIIGLTSNLLEAQTIWSLQNNPLPNGILLGKIQFVSLTEGWISASDGRLLHTKDAGITWSIVSPSQNDILSSIDDPSFSMNWVNQTQGWKMTWKGTNFDDANGAVLLKTIDGGNTWIKKELPKTISTITYSKADLQGTWQWHELVSANIKSLPSSWIGWGHGMLNIDGNGNGVFSGVVKSDGKPHIGSSVSMNITSGGVISEGAESHGFMSADKKTMYLTTNDKLGGYILGVGQKVIPATTYSTADLQGIWQMHVLSAGDILGRYSGWGHAEMTCDMNGNLTGTWVGPDNSQGVMNLSGTISSDGVITGFGPLNSGNHGFMSADKKSYILTMTGGDGNSDYNLVVFQKQESGTIYAAKDLQGRWQMHALTAGTKNNSNSSSNWMHGLVSVDLTGNVSVSNFVVNGSNLSDLSKSISISTDGMLSGSASSDMNGFMNTDKSFGIFTKTDGSGGYRLTVMQKDLSVSGDIGAQVQFVDENNGWASMFNAQIRTGVLYKTTDGGSTWDLIHSLPATDETTYFNFTDPNNGWMTTINDNPPLFQISKTTNGGSTWTAQYIDTTPNADTLSSSGAMQFIDSNNGWVVGPNGRILKTTNGGANWELLNNSGLGIYANSKCLFFLDVNNGWIGTNISDPNGSATQHIILHTNNGGQSWARQNVPFPGAVFSIFFKDANEGWFTGEQCVQNCNEPDSQKVWTGVIGHTTNGGATIIEESLANNQIIIYPNPSKSTLFINGLNLNSAVSIFDLSGTQLINKQVVNNQIDISQLMNGVYIVMVSDKNGNTMKKFIKQ